MFNPAHFSRALNSLKPGEEIIYHSGCLVRDRVSDPEINKVAKIAFKAAEAGECHLVQRIVVATFPAMYDYIAIKRPKPHKPVKWEGCYSPENRKLMP